MTTGMIAAMTAVMTPPMTSALMNSVSPTAMHSLRLGPAALSLAGYRNRRSGGRRDGAVPSHVRALRDRRRHAGSDVAGSAGDVRLLSTRTFRCGRHREVVTARRGSLATSEGQSRGEWLDTKFIRVLSCASRLCRSMAGRGVAARRGFLQLSAPPVDSFCSSGNAAGNQPS